MMTLEQLVFLASVDPAFARTQGLEIYWDTQDPDNEGAAWRTQSVSGSIDHVGWSGDCEIGMNLLDYFGPDGRYIGPDCQGVYPLFLI